MVTATECRNVIHILDKGFNSVYVLDTLAAATGAKFIGPIVKNLAHSPNGTNKKKKRKRYFETDEWKNRVQQLAKGDYIQFVCKEMHLTVIQFKETGKEVVYILDNCVNPKQLTKAKIDSDLFWVPEVVRIYRK